MYCVMVKGPFKNITGFHKEKNFKIRWRYMYYNNFVLQSDFKGSGLIMFTFPAKAGTVTSDKIRNGSQGFMDQF